MASQDPFGAAKMIETALGRLKVYDLNALEESGVGHVDRLPPRSSTARGCAP